MALERPRAKTENLSLRLDPKTKFMLDFMARLRGQSITAVVEQSIREAAAKTGIDGYDGNNEFSYRWSKYWDPSDGVRTLNLISEPEYPTTYEEDELRQFTLDHWPFFYFDNKGTRPRRASVDTLWSSMPEFLSIWMQTKATSRWSASMKMIERLRAAGMKAPTPWPPKELANAPSIADELDDDIPF